MAPEFTFLEYMRPGQKNGEVIGVMCRTRKGKAGSGRDPRLLEAVYKCRGLTHVPTTRTILLQCVLPWGWVAVRSCRLCLDIPPRAQL